jgi:hypothetical protein
MAKALFSTINAANRYAVLWRIARLVEMLARGETVHVSKPKD